MKGTALSLLAAASTVATTTSFAFNPNFNLASSTSTSSLTATSSPWTLRQATSTLKSSFVATGGKNAQGTEKLPRRTTTEMRAEGPLYNSFQRGRGGMLDRAASDSDDFEGFRRRKEGGRISGRGKGRGEGVVMKAALGRSKEYWKGADDPASWMVFDEDGNRVWNKCKDLVELGTSGLMVSKIGIGGVMFGGQMGEEQTHTVLDHAFDKAGINWLDTSESYPFPLIEKHKHKADPIVGSWLKGRDRSKIILCTKVAGRHEDVHWLRKDGSFPVQSRDHIMESVYGSLERMGTDYIDMLYLGDWPDRISLNANELYYKTEEENPLYLSIEEQLNIIQELKDQGLVRHVGLANDGPYGVTQFCEHAIYDGLPKIACIQAEYNIFTQHKVEHDLAEACCPRGENVAIVATQTLGGGALSMKYMFERSIYDRDLDWRLNMFPGYQARYNTDRTRKQILKYQAMAKRYSLTIQELCVAFVHDKPYITASIMGATNVDQIDQNVGALDKKIPIELLKEMETLQDVDLEPLYIPERFISASSAYFIDNVEGLGPVYDEDINWTVRKTPGYPGP